MRLEWPLLIPFLQEFLQLPQPCPFPEAYELPHTRHLPHTCCLCWFPETGGQSPQGSRNNSNSLWELDSLVCDEQSPFLITEAATYEVIGITQYKLLCVRPSLPKTPSSCFSCHYLNLHSPSVYQSWELVSSSLPAKYLPGGHHRCGYCCLPSAHLGISLASLTPL